MTEILNFIFPSGNYEELTTYSLLCLFIFMMVLECISAIVREAMRGAGMK